MQRKVFGFLAPLALSVLAAAAGPVRPPEAAPAPTSRKSPVAVVLAEAEFKPQIMRHLVPRLTGHGFHVLDMGAGGGGRPCSCVGDVLAAVEKAAASAPVDPNRILLVAAGRAGRAAMSFVEVFHRRLTGVVMYSVVPVRRRREVIHRWDPPEQAWSVPMWVVTGTEPREAANELLAWRRIAAAAPDGASLTLDPRPGRRRDALRADPAIDRWLAAIAAGKPPPLGPDRQAEAERKRYAPLAAELFQAVTQTPAAPPGTALAKRDGPMTIRVTAPLGWRRQPHRERAYDADASPYLQLYLAPAGQRRPFFAWACAVRQGPGEPGEPLADYGRRLADRGCLVIRHKSLRTSDLSFEISSILSPSRQKWHRWILLGGAARPFGSGGAAPMVLVMDASEAPDAEAMAAAAKRILRSVRVRWIGGQPHAARPGRTDASDLGARRPAGPFSHAAQTASPSSR